MNAPHFGSYAPVAPLMERAPAHHCLVVVDVRTIILVVVVVVVVVRTIILAVVDVRTNDPVLTGSRGIERWISGGGSWSQQELLSSERMD